MTEKRFTFDEYFNINDNKQQIILDGGEDAQDMLDLLNELNDENHLLKLEIETLKPEQNLDKNHQKLLKTCVNTIERLTDENEQLKQQLDYADDLIRSHLSEHFIRQWANFKMGHKEYNDFWEEKLKKYNELER